MELELELEFCIFSMEIKRVNIIRISPTELLEIRITIMCRWRGVKMEVLTICTRIWLGNIWYGIIRRGLNVLESANSELKFEHKFCIFSMEINSVIVI